MKVKTIITDLWYQPIDEDNIAIFIELPNDNREYILAEIEWVEHKTFPQEHIYNECLQIAHEGGYYLEGEIECHPCGDCAEFPDCKKNPKDCSYSRLFDVSVYNVGIDFTTLHDDYGILVGDCIVYFDKDYNDTVIMSFYYYHTKDNSLELVPRDSEKLSDNDILVVKEMLLENILTNIKLENVPTLCEYLGGKKYA